MSIRVKMGRDIRHIVMINLLKTQINPYPANVENMVSS